MSELKLVYSELEEASDHARKVADKCQDYWDELDKKMMQKWSSIPKSPLSTGNQRVDSASYYVNLKKKQLAEKKKDYKKFANDVDDLIEDAKAADRKVAKSVNNSREAFLNKHENLSGDGWAAFFAAVVVGVPVIGWVTDGITSAVEGLSDLGNNIRHWYEVGGGKKIVDSLLAIGEGVLAVCALISAVGALLAAGTFGAVFVAVAGLIAAVIGGFDAITNYIYQMKANSQSDPAWAQYYGGIDKTSDHFRKNIFKSKWLNQKSNQIANIIDIVDGICSLIDIADTIGKLYKRSGLKKIFSSKETKYINGKKISNYKFDFKKFSKTVFSKEGWKSIGKSLKYSWKGMLLGDIGGVEGWRKRWKRAFNSNIAQGKDMSKLMKTFKRVGKITEAFSDEFKKITTTLKRVQNIGECFMYREWSIKESYKTLKDVYSLTGSKGKVISVVDNIIDFQEKRNQYYKANQKNAYEKGLAVMGGR